MMPTALAEWTTERPDEPGFYWWRLNERDNTPEVVYLDRLASGWRWYFTGPEEDGGSMDGVEPSEPPPLWWPVRLDPPPVG